MNTNPTFRSTKHTTNHLSISMDNGKVIMPPPRVESQANSGFAAIPAEYVRPAWERGHLGDALEEVQKAEDGPQIPVVDLSEERAENVKAAAKEWGVMHVVNRGISSELTEKVRRRQGFFDLPVEVRERAVGREDTRVGEQAG